MRGCNTRVEGSEPLRRLALPGDVVVGPVAFTALKRVAARRELERWRTRDGYRVKSAVRVRAGAVVTLAVAENDAPFVSLEYAPGFRPSKAVQFRSCRPGTSAFAYDGPIGVATGFNGGFVVDGPRCVALDVWVRGRPAPLRAVVSFGAGRCAR